MNTIITGFFFKSEEAMFGPFKVGTHEGTSPCDWSLRLVPCSVYTKEIVAGTSPLKDLI